MCRTKHIFPIIHWKNLGRRGCFAWLIWQAKQFRKSRDLLIEGKKWLLDYRLSFPYFMIRSEEKMHLTSCFVIYTTAQFSCTNDLRSRKQEIRRGCRLYCLSGSTDRIQLRCHSHHIGTCMLKGQTWSGIQHSEQALDKVLSPERVEINSASKYHVQ